MLWHHVWTAVLAANLVIPMRAVPAAFDHRKFGEVGIALAVAVLWLIGDIAGLRSRKRRFILISGGLTVAVSQVIPILQVVAGMVSILVVGWTLGDPASEIGCFVATLLTGSSRRC